VTLIVDTGPIVAALHQDDHHHAWAERTLRAARGPLATCDAVISEACFLAERIRTDGPTAVVALCARKILIPSFRFADELAAVTALMRKYADVPMSFADACLVRMTELHDDPTVITTDSDFLVYRRNGRNTIRVIAPWSTR
jgi:predicted nucleic acid-binding protein